MARIRSIKPEFWTSEQIAECSPNARLLFIGIWSFSDDSGIHPASVKRLKMEIFPSDDLTIAQVSDLVAELVGARLLTEYSVSGETFWQVTGWKHQRIDQPTFKYPSPDGQIPTNRRRTFGEPDSANAQRTFDKRSPRERSGEERSGKERKDKATLAQQAAPMRPDYSAAFERFWKAYPNAKGKKPAFNSWKRKKLDPRADELIADVEARLSRDRKWREEGGRFIPYGSTYVSEERWEDKIDEAGSPPPSNGGTGYQRMAGEV